MPAVPWPQLPPFGFYPVPIEGKSEYKPETEQRDTDITKALDLPERISEKIRRVRELETEIQEMGKKKLEEKLEEKGEMDEEQGENNITKKIRNKRHNTGWKTKIK